MRGHRAVFIAVAALAFACGGSQTPAESPEPTTDDVEQSSAAERKAEVDQPSEGGEEGAEGGEKAEGKAGAEPEFKDGMSVDEAINAVPQGTDRMNIDPDALGRPLADANLYKPCKLAPSQHLKIRVAIWEGKAVGIDVVATPKNDKAVSCVKDQIKTVTWKDKVKSLNTVDYAL